MNFLLKVSETFAWFSSARSALKKSFLGKVHSRWSMVHSSEGEYLSGGARWGSVFATKAPRHYGTRRELWNFFEWRKKRKMREEAR